MTMKNCLNLVTVTGCFLAASSMGAFAQDNGFYAGADLGGTITDHSELKEFFGPVASEAKVTFDPGVRLGLNGGYHVTDWLGVEGQTGIMSSAIDGISGATYVHDAWLDNVPLMGGVRLELPQSWRKFGLSPFVGGGVGGSVSLLSADHLNYGGTSFHGTDGNVAFAYQAFAGLRYAINDHMSVGAEYHYFATGNDSWRNTTFGTATDRIRMEGINLHAVSLAFQYRF